MHIDARRVGKEFIPVWLFERCAVITLRRTRDGVIDTDVPHHEGRGRNSAGKVEYGHENGDRHDRAHDVIHARSEIFRRNSVECGNETAHDGETREHARKKHHVADAPDEDGHDDDAVCDEKDVPYRDMYMDLAVTVAHEFIAHEESPEDGEENDAPRERAAFRIQDDERAHQVTECKLHEREQYERWVAASACAAQVQQDDGASRKRKIPDDRRILEKTVGPAQGQGVPKETPQERDRRDVVAVFRKKLASPFLDISRPLEHI